MIWLVKFRSSKLLAGILLLALFAGAFGASVALFTPYIEALTGLRTEGSSVFFTPRHTFNGIHEWGPRDRRSPGEKEWGLKVRPDTPAEATTIWRDLDEDDDFERMQVDIRLDGDLRAQVQLDPSDAAGPVSVTCSVGNTSWEYRDVNGDGILDMVLERVLENSAARLIKASVQYWTGFENVILEKPFNDKECTITTLDNVAVELVFSESEGVWLSRTEVGQEST